MNAQPQDRADGTVGKALDVLERVAASPRPVRFAEILAASPYPKATLYRLLQTLLRQRMLVFDAEAGTYRPGLRLVRMAHAAWDQSSLAPVARPHLDALSRATGQTVHLAQLDGGSVLYVDKRNADNPVEMFSAAGKVGPAYCTGVGKAMLAHLPPEALAEVLAQQSWHRFTDATIPDAAAMASELAAIRRDGVAFDRQEHEPGIHCVAMAIVSGAGRALGAVSVTGSTDRGDPAELERHVPALREAARNITRALRDWRFPDRGEG